MSERQFRFIMGVALWLALVYSAFYETMMPLFIFVCILLFEGITNLRLPGLINRLRYGKSFPEPEESACNVKWFNKIESERILRFIVSIFVLVPFYVLPEIIWFMPWFVASMLILAGITNICPMVMFMKWAGLK